MYVCIYVCMSICMYVCMYVCMHAWMLKMPEWLGISDMSNVSHILVKWELCCFIPQNFGSIQLPSSGNGSCMLLKRWKDSSHLASVCETFGMYVFMCVGVWGLRVHAPTKSTHRVIEQCIEHRAIIGHDQMYNSYAL